MYINATGQALLGLDGIDHVRKTTMYNYVVEEEMERFQGQILPALDRDGRWEGEITLRNLKTGARIPMWHHIFYIMDTEGARRLALATISRDITQRQEMENLLLESSMREHRRIGQELHDSVGQELTGIGFLATGVLQKLKARNSPESKQVVMIADGIDRALGEIRSIARGLVPVEVDAEGLVSALEELAMNAQSRFGIVCDFEHDPFAQVKNSDIATHLYFIAQEAITNSVKHGKAKHIRISLQGTDPIVLKIEDDGLGFETSQKRAKGTGLQIMQHRAQLTGAQLNIESRPRAGVRITFALPNQPPGIEP